MKLNDDAERHHRRKRRVLGDLGQALSIATNEQRTGLAVEGIFSGLSFI